ncbi:TetR/AcrR family transcriptional regulator [Streptomyces albus]|uniref:TetR/AcrR family transcriptional regulator n=1 Tax=Streptomyces albus TaxID=1888 RepID=UPI0024AD7FD0|nr:TetR/AcrR family transcriptional regulator [Streptomyces albus]MDI6408972.1 TetR/AcrR family transcriptional regulator [Streptomyces albus]
MRANGAATGAAPPGRPRPAAGSGGATEAGGTGGGSRYHHGDLRNALLRAAVALAAEGGPDAVVLRAAARQAGVSATAAYRHFDGHGELLGAVAEHARRRLVTRMEAARRQTRGGTGREAARERLLTLGRGYLGFAREEPGLYRTAFRHRPCGSAGRPGTGTPAGSPGPRSGWGSRPLAVLAAALDEAVAAGLVPAGRRAGSELSTWAMLHGAAMLLLDGPLGALGEEEAARVLDRVPHDIVAGLTAPEGPGTRSL